MPVGLSKFKPMWWNTSKVLHHIGFFAFNRSWSRRSVFRFQESDAIITKILAILFLTMNFLDFGLTKHFLNHTAIEESHPVARYIIDHNGGIRGLAILKSISTAIVLMIAYWIARKKPIVARNVLLLGSFVVGLAVGTTCYSLFAHDAEIQTWDIYFQRKADQSTANGITQSGSAFRSALTPSSVTSVPRKSNQMSFVCLLNCRKPESLTCVPTTCRLMRFFNPLR